MSRWFVPALDFSLASWAPTRLADLLQYFDPTYSPTLLESRPVFVPKETGTVAVPRGQRCALFDGSNDECTTTLTIGTSLTLAAWIKPAASGTQSIFVANNSGSSGNVLRYNGSTTIQWFPATSTTQVNITVPNISTVWSHLAITQAGTTYTLYINGSQVATGTTVALEIGGNNFAIGRYAGGNAFNGSMYEVLVDDEAYTAGEVATLYSTHLPPAGKTPLGFWPLQDEGVLNGGQHYNVVDPTKPLIANNITASTYNATDSGVTFNYNNWKGYTLSGNVVIPASLSTPSQDAAGNALGVAGPVAHPVTTEVKCFSGDGTAAYINCATPLIPATANFTLSFWYWGVAGAAYDRVLSQPSLRAGGFEIVTDGAGTRLRFFLNNDAGTLDVTATTVVGAWNLIVVTRVGNLWSISANGNAAATYTLSYSVTQAVNTFLMRYAMSSGNFSPDRIAGLSITTGGVTKYPLFDQCGPGSSNTNRDFYILGSDGSATLVSGGIVSGTISNIYANRCPYTRDWCIQYGGSCNPNLLSYTEAFDNAAWVKLGATVTANSDGTADALLDAAVSEQQSIYQNAITTTVATLSVSAKPNGRNNVALRLYSAIGQVLTVVFNVATGVVTQTTNQGTTFSSIGSSITAEADGYYRCSITATRSSGSIIPAINIVTGDTPTLSTAGSQVYTGNGTGLLIKNAQLELGSLATPYRANLTTPNGAFIPGRIGSPNDATGNVKTLAAGKHGNPYSRIVPNPWNAPALVNGGVDSNDKLAPADTYESITTATDDGFSRHASDGADRYFKTVAPLTGTNLTKADGYTQ